MSLLDIINISINIEIIHKLIIYFVAYGNANFDSIPL